MELAHAVPHSVGLLSVPEGTFSELPNVLLSSPVPRMSFPTLLHSFPTHYSVS